MDLITERDIDNHKKGFVIAFILALLVIVTFIIGIIWLLFSHPLIAIYSIFAMVAVGIYKKRDELFYSFNK